MKYEQIRTPLIAGILILTIGVGTLFQYFNTERNTPEQNEIAKKLYELPNYDNYPKDYELIGKEVRENEQLMRLFRNVQISKESNIDVTKYKKKKIKRMKDGKAVGESTISIAPFTEKAKLTYLTPINDYKIGDESFGEIIGVFAGDYFYTNIASVQNLVKDIGFGGSGNVALPIDEILHYVDTTSNRYKTNIKNRKFKPVAGQYAPKSQLAELELLFSSFTQLQKDQTLELESKENLENVKSKSDSLVISLPYKAEDGTFMKTDVVACSCHGDAVRDVLNRYLKQKGFKESDVEKFIERYGDTWAARVPEDFDGSRYSVAFHGEHFFGLYHSSGAHMVQTDEGEKYDAHYLILLDWTQLPVASAKPKNSNKKS